MITVFSFANFTQAPRLDTDGINLLSSFLLFEAKKRLPAREALKHPYFSSFPSEVTLLKDGKPTIESHFQGQSQSKLLNVLG